MWLFIHAGIKIMPTHLSIKPTSAQATAQCRQAISHYLSQRWPCKMQWWNMWHLAEIRSVWLQSSLRYPLLVEKYTQSKTKVIICGIIGQGQHGRWRSSRSAWSVKVILWVQQPEVKGFPKNSNLGICSKTQHSKHPNSLGPSDTIWRQRSGSILAHVMACCLTAPSHYLKQCSTYHQ